ncbi:ADAMTS-like protein 4 isoform X2 [Aquarana catesbeiana]|uniref:ADAMTS-like protein 4 isoform X2 n=1 Tax=Aquarana catesbeiana TaxID=8400 RepID=UPI003CC9C224
MLGLQYVLLPLAIIHLSYCGEKLPHRTPRQALEDEVVENKIAGVWGLWGPWSSCSQTCGLGVIERSRTCLTPYQQVPWMPRSEPNPHIVQPQPQPPFHDDRSNVFSMGPARPSYPFHTEGEIAAAYVDPYMPRNPSSSRYNLFNRNTRQETVPDGSQLYPRREYSPYHRSTTNRGRGVPRNPDTLWQPSPLDVPHRQDALRASETISIHRKPHKDSPIQFNARNASRSDDSSAPWPFFPDSIPLLKPESWEETNLGQALPPLTPTKESRFSRRSRVRNAIKPGKYGYGKVPFALPLHTEKEESQRSKRHHKIMTFSTTASPRQDNRKELRPTKPSMESQRMLNNQSPSQATDIIGTSSKRRLQLVKKPKRFRQSDYSSWTESPEYDFSIGKNVDSAEAAPKLKSSIKGTDGNQDSQFVIWDSWVDFDGHRDTSEKARVEDPEELNNRRTMYENVLAAKKLPQIHKISSTPMSPVNQALKHVEEDELIRTSILKSSATQVKKENSKKILSTKITGTVRPMQSKLLGHRVDVSIKNRQPAESERNHHDRRFIYEHSNRQVTKTIQNNDSISDEATENEQKAEMSHQPRSRSQRQSPYRHNTDSSRAYHSLYKDNPVQGDPWTSLGRNLPMTFDRGQDQRSSQHQNTELPQWNLYNPGTEEFHCEGEKKQYKSCNQEPCPASQPDARTLQCSTFNNQEFMGRLYQWEAFTEVHGNQRCALNCRPIGYRFYVRHTEKVQDGSPCEPGSLDVCVDGQCLSPGCDGILGSNSTLDTCGVCGGDGSTCKFITGTFKDTNVPIGYHKILEIPKGATQISIRELTWSPNYLALRNRAGKSIVNGNWAVDPPGKYEAGGTAFIYNQPSRDEQEGESFTAPGPTSEALDVYMIFQQDNPGVSFQYFIASPPSSDIPGHVPNVPQQEHGPQRSVPSIDSVPQTNPRGHPVERHLVPPPQARPPPPPRPAGTLQRNVRIPPLPAPPTHYWPEQPQFFWRRAGNTPCSVTCGKGFWYPVYQCVSRSSLDEVSEEECDLSNKPFPQEEACNTQPCPAFWDIGNWSVCSRTCGPGIQHRQVLCRQIYANRTTMVHPQRCGHLPKPNVTQTCQLRICSQWEIQSNWSTCSVMCGVGQRTRHVRCISSQGDEVGDGECSNRLRPRTNEACDMGPCVRSWFHNEWSSTCSSECGMGIQRRSVFCLSSSASDESQESCGGTKPSDMRVCNSGPCERIVKWYTGPWSECSADCDEGSQRRDVICISKLGTEFNVTDPSECAHLDKPTGLQSCNAGSCGSRWFTSPWSTCSQSCLGGLQVREVRCLTADKSFSQLCDLDSKPDEKKTCNTQPCSAVLDENCRDRYHNCAVVVQARLCVYAYYKQACCSSCSHSLQRTRASENR